MLEAKPAGEWGLLTRTKSSSPDVPLCSFSEEMEEDLTETFQTISSPESSSSVICKERLIIEDNKSTEVILSDEEVVRFDKVGESEWSAALGGLGAAICKKRNGRPVEEDKRYWGDKSCERKKALSLWLKFLFLSAV